MLRSHPLRLCEALEADSCRSNGHLQPSWPADVREGVAQELPTCPPLLCASHLLLTGAVAKELAHPLSGLCCPKKSKARPERVNRSRDPQPGTFECLFVHLCGCSLLLRTLQAVVIVQALTA